MSTKSFDSIDQAIYEILTQEVVFFAKMGCAKILKTLTSRIYLELSCMFTYGLCDMTVAGKYLLYGIHTKVTADLLI